MSISDCAHWGYVAVVRAGVEYYKHVRIYFGDSLRWQPPAGILKTRQYHLCHIFPKIKISVARENYSLGKLNYEEQLDGYSCEFYVLSAASNFCMKRGFMPVETFKNRGKKLSETFRQACIQALLTMTLRAINNFGSTKISDFRVVSYSREIRRSLRLEGRQNEDITNKYFQDSKHALKEQHPSDYEIIKKRMSMKCK